PSDALDRVLARGAWTPTIGFGPQGQWQAGPPDADNAFDVLRNGALMGRLESTQAGEHNQQNALAAIAAANHVGVTPQAAIGALSVFEGVRRRLELRGVVQGIHVYD